MLGILVDQDFDHDILRGLRLRLPDLDAVTALQAGLDQASDPEVLAWAAAQHRVVVTHDRNTMPAHTYDPWSKGHSRLGWNGGAGINGDGPVVDVHLAGDDVGGGVSVDQGESEHNLGSTA
jgi:hypothetical protein